MKLAGVLQHGIRQLSSAGIDDAERQAKLLLMAAAGIDRTAIVAFPEREISTEQFNRFNDHVTRRTRREPLQYIIGNWEFYGLEFLVRPGVLIPRPETEILVEDAIHTLSKIDDPKFIEVGVGSGCISIAILANVPNATAIATDISPEAIDVARENAIRLCVSDRLELIKTNALEGVEVIADLIVSNPPYIPNRDREWMQPEVVDHEPETALFSGDEGLDVIRLLAHTAHRNLKPEAPLLIEIGHDQSNTASELFDQKIYTRPTFLSDLQGIPRILKTSRA